MTTEVVSLTTSPTAPTGTDERLALLEEVDFKWLMAGHGWWIDTSRLHNDPDYATHMLDLVDSTPSTALKNCASLLRAQVRARH